MTEYYDRKTVNSKHLVKFSDPKQYFSPNLFYYDFDTKTWLRCHPLDFLPYNLCSFKLDWGTEEKCVVTCKDSYRLTEKIPENTDHDFMLREKVWRDEIVHAGAEFDWNLKGEWVKGKVCWTKADIIPGVVVIGPRNCPNINGWGYYYKESKRFAESCTYTRIISQVDLDEEERERQAAIKRRENREECVKEWSEKIGMKCPEKYKHAAYSAGMCGRMGFVDTLPYYHSLKRCPIEMTKEVIGNSIEKEEDRRKFLEEDHKTMIGLIGLVSKASDGYSVVYDSNEIKPQYNKYNDKHYATLSGSDGFFDIRVHNATFAYLYCGDRDDDNEYNRKIDLEKVNMDGKDIFTFTDITYDNPLMPAQSGSQLTFFTNGDLVTYKSIWMDVPERTILHTFGNSYAISHFPKLGRILLNGHVWQPSMSLSYDELIDVPLPKEDLNLKSSRPVMMSMSMESSVSVSASR